VEKRLEMWGKSVLGGAKIRVTHVFCAKYQRGRQAGVNDPYFRKLEVRIDLVRVGATLDVFIPPEKKETLRGRGASRCARRAAAA
jgi:hypothetical protein